jgi:hypothetical protein
VLIINKGRSSPKIRTENLQASLIGAERVIVRVRGDADELPTRSRKSKARAKWMQNRTIRRCGIRILPPAKTRVPEVAKQVIKDWLRIA